MVLTIVRGLPGSGKSVVAKALAEALDAAHVEADMFFTKDDGTYVYEREKQGDAHDWCRNMADQNLANGRSVVVSNTFTTMKECLPYLQMAGRHGSEVQVITCQATLGSTHGVPDEVIEKMADRWEDLYQIDGPVWGAEGYDENEEQVAAREVSRCS